MGRSSQTNKLLLLQHGDLALCFCFQPMWPGFLSGIHVTTHRNSDNYGKVTGTETRLELYSPLFDFPLTSVVVRRIY